VKYGCSLWPRYLKTAGIEMSSGERRRDEEEEGRHHESSSAENMKKKRIKQRQRHHEIAASLKSRSAETVSFHQEAACYKSMA